MWSHSHRPIRSRSSVAMLVGMAAVALGILPPAALAHPSAAAASGILPPAALAHPWAAAASGILPPAALAHPWAAAVQGTDAAFNPEARLRELGIVLPAAEAPVANYVKAVRSGNLVFLAGHGPCGPGSEALKGKLGRERSIDEGYQAARLTAICLLSSLKAEIGDLHKVVRVVRVFGMVNAVPEFSEHPKVINGASDLLVAVFGERGRHARAAVGMASLPFGIAVEIEMVVEVDAAAP